MPEDEFDRELSRLLAADAWVLDGNYNRTLGVRIPAADTIIFLDRPRLVCLWRVLKRRIRFHRRSRPDMPADCPERISWEFIEWIWNYPRRARPRVLEQLHRAGGDKRIVILRSTEDAERFVSSLAAIRS